MKRSKTSSRKALSGDRQRFARPSNQVRRRAATFKLEALEGRTLLSVSPSGTAASPYVQTQLQVTGTSPAVVSPSDLTIDGNVATAVSVLDSHDLVFSFPTTADGVHNVSISGLTDIHGVTLTPDKFSFKTDTVPPYIVSSSLVNGSVFSPAPQNVTEVVTFSEPMNTSLTPSIDLYGEIRNIHPAAASDTWDSTGTVLTIQYNNLPSDAYQFNLYTSGFQDLAGNTLVSGLTTNFTVTGGTSDLTGLTPVLPLGSLVYQTTVDNALLSQNDTDTYDLAIDPHQTLAVIVTPVTPGMTATVNLISPAGNVIGTATSPSSGAPAVLYGVQSSLGGTYQFQVSGGPGEYTIQPILNAYVDPAAYGGAPNNSIATATTIDPYANKFIGHDDRTAVLGEALQKQGPVYSFSLNQGESASLALESLNGKKASFTLYDDNGNVLGKSYPGATNYTQGLNNFVAQADATYYVQVTGDPQVKFNLVVTRGADFTTQNHNTLGTAQDVTATQQSGDNSLGGALGYLVNPSGAQVSSTIEGIDYNGSNSVFPPPPDSNAAVGNGFVSETVNVQFRVWDTSGNLLLDEPLNTLFGGTTGGDPYVEYDSIAQRWYVTGIDDVTHGDEFLAVSNDANPLDGFSAVYEVPLAAPGDLPDFTKFGYNADAIVLEAQDFSSSTGNFVQTVVTTVDKNALLSGTLTYYQSVPPAEFRALTPAQMHGAAPGSPMWFISTDGYTFPASTIRVTEMTNLLSNSPTYTTYSLPVNTFGYTTLANQPGAPGSVETNDPTTTSVDFLNGLMVTALAATDASDGFQQTHVHWYEVDVSSGTPVLVQEGLINPGPGVATYFGAAAIDPAGNIGLSYMESSSTEYVSAYVAGHIAGTPLGTTTAGTVFAPGGGSMPDSFREGDYGSAVYDPGTGLFWGANEYIGSDGSTDIWRTKITSFSVVSAIGTDFYSVNANTGDNLHFATSTPAGGPNEFVNNFYPELLLYDPNGNLVAVAAGNAADGRNSVIDFTVPEGDAGSWVIEVTASPNTDTPSSGEYGLLVTGATGSLSPFVVTGTTPAAGALLQPPTDIIVTFNDPVLGTSLTPGELEVNGVAATVVTQVNANTVDWSVPASAYATGIDLPNVVTIGADLSGNQVMDVSGQTLTPYSYTFYTTNVAPYIVSSSIDNQVFSPAPANVTEVVTFSQPMDTSFTTASSFSLMGNYRNVQYAAASFSWDPTGTILTINYANLPDDTYTLTLYASGFENSVGIPLASNYVANFAVALGTVAFPTPLTAVPPLGDLIYTGTDNHVLVTPTDVDGLTLALNAGETLTLIGTPTGSAQQLVITVLDPNNNTIGMATASAPGQAVTLETVPVDSTGTYTIQISDAGGNLGLYSIQAYLNSYIKQGTSNDTIGTAQDLSSSSYLLGPGDADRLGVVDPNPPLQDTQDYYSFDLTQGQSTTIVAESLNGLNLQITLVDGDGNVLATGVGGSTNVDSKIENFVAQATGTYYVEITGDPGVQYSLTVTRSANFDIEPNNTPSTAQSLTGTNGVLGALDPDSSSLSPAVDNDWYSINVAAGNSLYLQSYTPSDQGGQFINTTAVNLELYDTFGNLVAVGTPTGDGRNEAIFFEPPVTGTYYIHVFNNPGNSGEYYLSVETAQYQSGAISGEVYNDLNGSGSLLPGDPGLNNWEIDVYDSNNNFVASQLTANGGYFDVTGLAPGTYTVAEVLQSGWTQTAPLSYTYIVTVAAGQTSSGNDFGNFQNITISGEKFNDLTGSGTFVPGDPGLPGWTIDLLDATGAIVATAVTDQNGDYSFTDVGPGVYTVQEELQPGWIQTFPAPPGTYTVTATSGSDQTGLLFGNFQLVTFAGTVYNDLNGNGVLDQGDPGLQGWTVNLLDSSGNIVATTTSADDGTYSFSDVGPSTYTIEEVNQTGWYQTEPVNPPGTYTEQAISSTNLSGLDFGNFQLVNVTGQVYNDRNGNGSNDGGTDPGLQGWTVLLLDPSGNTVATTTSDMNGNYMFANLFPGTFTVEEILQAGWIQTQPVNPNYYQFTTQSGMNQTGLDFGNFVNSENFYGTVYNDLVGNGIVDAYDPPLAGWTINVLNSGGSVVATTTSAKDGTYSFTALPVQQYTIQEVTPPGWVITEPTNPPGTYTLPGLSGIYTGLDFGNFQLVSVSGNVYNDLNGNGNQDPGDAGLKGWMVDVINSSGQVVASALTDPNGNYTIGSIGPGSYTLAEVVQSGWVETQPVNPTYYSFTTSSGTNIAGGIFGNFQTVTLSGEVYNDLNGDGMIDPGDTGFSGWTVNLLNSQDKVIATTTTDSNGNYSFAGVGPGAQTLQEVPQNGPGNVPYLPTVPSTGTIAITPTSGTNRLGLNFGNILQPEVVDLRIDWGSESMSILNLTRNLPFININAIDIIFNENVIVSKADLTLESLINSGNSYNFSGFSYIPATHDAKWSLPTAIGVDSLMMALEGVHVNPGIYLNEFTQKFKVLPGDVNGDGVVNSLDMGVVRNEIVGISPETVWADLDGALDNEGNIVIDMNDYNAVKKRLGSSLS